MNRHMILYQNLERLRDHQSSRWEPIPLWLPVDMPYWPVRDSANDESEEKQPSRVVIIDMNDYTEVEF